MLVADQIAFRFHHRAPRVWESISFSIRAGERVALVGPNGCGKSTLLAVLAALLHAEAGEVARPALCEGRVACGLVLQNPDLMLFCRTVEEELAFGPRQLGLDRAQIAQRVESAAVALDLAAHLDQPPMALSQGERLRTAVAATLTLAPRALLLDEPTTGQDLRQVERVMQRVAAHVAPGGEIGALVFATHDVRTVARHATRVLVLAGGGMLADCTPEQLLADDALLAAAHLRRTPLLEVRHRLRLTGWTAGELADELTAERPA